MATKKAAAKPEPKAAMFDDELQAKIDAYATLHGTTPMKVVILALDDFFHNVDQGKWPRSSSILEKSPLLG